MELLQSWSKSASNLAVLSVLVTAPIFAVPVPAGTEINLRLKLLNEHLSQILGPEAKRP